MEGYFPPEDKDKWIDAIIQLTNINKLVQDDVRDLLILHLEETKKKISIHLGSLTLKGTSKEDTKTSEKEVHRLDLVRRNSKMIKSQKSVNKGQSKEKVIKKRSSKKGLAEIEQNDFFITLGKKTETLRPPAVWNYPIERIDTTPHQVTLIKKEKK